MHLGLAFEHIQTGCRDTPLAQRLGQRGVVHDTAARNVDQRGRGLHLRQLRRADGVVRSAV
jgi:hypothetical protein